MVGRQQHFQYVNRLADVILGTLEIARTVFQHVQCVWKILFGGGHGQVLIAVDVPLDVQCALQFEWEFEAIESEAEEMGKWSGHLLCTRGRFERLHRHSGERIRNRVMCPHISDDFHRNEFWNDEGERERIPILISYWYPTVLESCCSSYADNYMAILTAFRINILALLNSRFTTHAFAVCRNTSMAILVVWKNERKSLKIIIIYVFLHDSRLDSTRSSRRYRNGLRRYILLFRCVWSDHFQRLHAPFVA